MGILKDALIEGLKNLPHRDDALDGLIHVSDVSNGCNTQKWHVIHAGVLKEFSWKEQLKFQIGFMWEDLCAKIARPILLKRGWRYIESVANVGEDGVVGHEDDVYEMGARRLLVEYKSSAAKFKPKRQEDIEEDQRHYFLQATGYSDMPTIRATEATVFVLYYAVPGGPDCEEYSVDLQRFRPIYAERLKTMQSAQGDVEPDPVLPSWTMRGKTSYLCNGCPVVSCRLNPAQKANAA